MASRPKQPVAKGGLWSSQKPTVRKETQDLLKGRLLKLSLSYCAVLIPLISLLFSCSYDARVKVDKFSTKTAQRTVKR